MSNDVLYPLLIGAGSLLVVVVVHLLTRPRPSRADIRVPEAASAAAPSASTRPSASALADWHREYEGVVLDFVDHHDAAIGSAADADPAAGSVDAPRRARAAPRTADDVGDALDGAGASHPAADMRAELAALRTAADAMTMALERDDADAAGRHHEVYLAYRQSWLERLRQFPVDRERIDVALGRSALLVPASQVLADASDAADQPGRAEDTPAEPDAPDEAATDAPAAETDTEVATGTGTAGDTANETTPTDPTDAATAPADGTDTATPDETATPDDTSDPDGGRGRNRKKRQSSRRASHHKRKKRR